jgi:hypothetical protein
MKQLSKKEIHYSLFGNILGNGYLRRNSSTGHWVESTHANKQRDYVVWLEALYTSWGLKTTTRYDYKRLTTYGEHTYSQVSCKLQTNRHVDHSRVLNSNGIKYVSKYVADRITPIGLLLWWLDNGSLSVHVKANGSVSRHGSLATHNLDYNSQLTIQRMFKQRFNIDVKIYKAKGSYCIYLNATNLKLFFDLLRPYLTDIPNSMKYKFNMKYTSKPEGTTYCHIICNDNIASSPCEG